MDQPGHQGRECGVLVKRMQPKLTEKAARQADSDAAHRLGVHRTLSALSRNFICCNLIAMKEN